MRKTDQNQSSTLTIDSPEIARIFSDDRKRTLLLMFAHRPRSVSEVAAETGQPVSKTFYHVANMVRRGLLKVAREEKRHGRPVKYYSTVSPSFFLPAEVMERPAIQSMAKELRESLEANFMREDIEGVTFSLDENGGTLIEPVYEKERRRTWTSLWRVVALTDEQAVSLAEDMRKLLAKYDGQGGGRKTYIIHSALSERLRR